MNVLVNLILTTSILVLGITVATQPGMLLEYWRNWAEKKKDEGWGVMDAVLICHWCMPSLWAILGYGFALATGVVWYFNWKIALMYPLVVMGSSVLNGIVWATYQMISEIAEHFRKMNEDK